MSMRNIAFQSLALMVIAGITLGSGATQFVCAADGHEGDHTEKTTDHKGDGHDTDDADADHSGDGHAPGGVPLDFKKDLAIWSLVVFIVFVGVLRLFAWGPLIAGLDKREEGIRANIAEAESARVKAEELLAEHRKQIDQVQDEVREIIAEARRDAEHTKQEIVSEAQKEAEQTKQRAIAEIERSRDAALSDLFDAATTQVVSATEQVLARSLTADDQDRLIDEALSQFRQG